MIETTNWRQVLYRWNGSGYDFYFSNQKKCIDWNVSVSMKILDSVTYRIDLEKRMNPLGRFELIRFDLLFVTSASE